MVEVAAGGGGGGASSSSNSDGTTYNIKPNPVPPGGEEQSMQYPEIMQILHGLKPGDVASAGDAFKNLANVLDAIASDLATTGNHLGNTKSWEGAAAQAAMNKFQQLHDQAAELAAKAHNTAGVAHWLGKDVLPQYQSIPSPEVMSKSESDAVIGGVVAGPGGAAAGTILGAFGVGSDGTGKANNAARGYLASLNGHIRDGIRQLPDYVNADNSNQWQTPPGSGPGSPVAPGGPGSPVTGYPPGGYGGGGPFGGGGGMPPYTPPGSGRIPSPKLSSGNGGPTSAGTLQGYTPPPGGGTPPPFGGGSPGGMPGGGSANPFSRLGMMPGGGPGAGEGAMPGESALADGAAGDAAAADGAAAGEAAGAAGVEGAEGAGMGGMPMGGSGSGQQDKERQRQAWMHEDEDIWGVPKDDVGPVIG